MMGVRLAHVCALVLGLCALFSPGMSAKAQSQAPQACQGHDAITYLCGARNVEDMVLIPGTSTIIASSYDSGANSLNLIDAQTRVITPLDISVPTHPDRVYAACPSPPDLTHFSSHGIALREGARGRHTLYVINHGGRESVEIFAIDAHAANIHARWIGCVVLPDGASGNSVAPLADGGFVVTKFYDTHSPQRPQFVGRQRTGLVYRWSPRQGLSEVPNSAFVGDNGVIVSPDGRSLYVTSWIDRKVTRIPLDGNGETSSVSVDFMPDNVNWAPDGSIIVAGQATDIDMLVACKHTRCPLDWAVARLDPATMNVSYLYWEKGTPDFAGATTALQVGDKFWIGTFRGDRIAIADVPSEPLHP